MFLSILLPQSRNLTPSLRTTVQSELVCTKKYFTPFCYSLLIYPKLLPLWSVPNRQKDREILHPLKRGALPAGATLLGWPNYGVDGRLN